MFRIEQFESAVPALAKCKVINSREFSYLALASTNVEFPFCTFLDTERYVDTLAKSAVMILTTEALAAVLVERGYGVCIIDNPREAFFELHNYLSEKPPYKREEFKTIIGNNCQISPLSSIASNNVKIGNGVIIEEFVVIRENTTIGDNTIIRTGCKIGGIGYEFKRLHDGTVMGVSHIGGTKIGNHVELQQNCCVDRAIYPWDNTVIGDYTTTDNMVHIGHAAKIGSRVMMPASVTISGRTVIGDDTWVGVGATVSNGLTISNKARVSIGSVVTKNVSEGQTVTGNFAIPHEKFIDNLKKCR